MKRLLKVITPGMMICTSACTPAAPECNFEYVAALLETEAGYTDVTKQVGARWSKIEESLPGLKRVYRGVADGPTVVLLGWDQLAKDITGVSAEALEQNSEKRASLAVRSDEKGWFRFDRSRPFTSYITVEFAQNGVTIRDWTPEIFATNHCVVAVRFRVEGGENAAAWPKVFEIKDRIRAAILAHEGPTT